MSRVLVVEDEQHLAEGLRFNLEAEGYQVQLVDTGEAALEKLTAESHAFDVVILDVMLPGIDGFGVVSQMRELGQFVPTLILTARGYPDDVLRGFAAGADDYLTKPFDLSILIARIRGLLRRREWLRAAPVPAQSPAEPDGLEARLRVWRQVRSFRPAGAARARPGVSADSDGGQRTSVSYRARGPARVAEGDARQGLGTARGYRHPRHRQLHRAVAAIYRGRSHSPAALADGARRRLPVRGVTGGLSGAVADKFCDNGIERPVVKLTLLLLAGVALFLGADTATKLNYPVAPKSDQVDDYHGAKIADPYRGLENADAASTQKWVEQENALTFGYLAKLPGREAIKKQLTELWNYEKFGGFEKAGNHYFYFHNSGLQNQAVLYVMDSLNGPARELLDPNTYRKDGTTALAGESVSWNGKLLGYAVAQAGSDWAEWRVRDVATGKDASDLIQWTKGSSISWAADDRGFYYARYAEPPPEKLLTVAALDQKVYFHKLGDPQSADKLIYERPDHPNWTISPR